MRLANWTRLSSAALWQEWCTQFPSVAQAEAAAIFAANRLVKQAAVSSKHRFYEVKDCWLRRAQGHLIEGRIARVERRWCRVCNPLGLDRELDNWRPGQVSDDASEDEDWCYHCGTNRGIYDERTLYVHYLNIEGVRYSFHSYEKPAQLCDLPGEDKAVYGGQFTEAEWEALGLPCSALVRMLRWLMMAVWFDQGRPVPRPTTPQAFTCHCTPWPGREPGQHHALCRKRLSGEGSQPYHPHVT